MITRQTTTFFEFARGLATDFGPATARAAFLVAPDGFRLAEQSASDNRYMAQADRFDAACASTQHRDLHRALSEVVPTVCFAGDPEAPDDVFPNNVFATAAGRYVVGRMRHAVRQREAERADIRSFFGGVLDYAEIDLSTQPHPCELTGSLVIDRARGLGFCGLSERCDEAGARLMHDALGLRATLMFDLAPGEYHANVVLAVLAGRAALICPGGFADAAVAEGIAAFYAPHAVVLSDAEHRAFAGNAIALSDDVVWMSAYADRALSEHSRDLLAGAGFRVRSVELDAIEAGGGSLRCCVGEVF
ncbi:arginine deiminase-related protein [Lysobacter sp. LF1]|uniref:Arginine deiminase-related protein n=1 Tax=Lysobacter stagni TaxID=3045172 RepID=A0ABT6XFG1_9GAMM|nr:arginine deiminase-related protein [Lysobacter sp. LF1]MDI9238653.1 arginine deiminase-related protein [Lysobacter sp. LF1]